MWNATNLENLARTYWRFLSRVTLGLIRVVYGENERSVVFLRRPLTLLRFDAPEYDLERDHGSVRWRIRDGLLVARAGRGCGFLALDVTPRGRRPDGRARLLIEVEVANFYPAIAAGFSTPVYEIDPVRDPRAGDARVPALAGEARPRDRRRSAASRPPTCAPPAGPLSLGPAQPRDQVTN